MQNPQWLETPNTASEALSNMKKMPLILAMLLILAASPGTVHAESFLDKLKAAVEKTQQQQQQQTQQTQQQRQQASPQPQSAPAVAQPQPQQQRQVATQNQSVQTTGPVKEIKSFDIRDISLGMTPEEAEKALRKIYPDFNIVPVGFDSYGQKWIGILAAMPKTENRDEVVLVDFTQPPSALKVIAVTRYKEFPATATPSLDNVESGLIEKYGQWSKGLATTRGGYHKDYGWWTNQSQNTCIDEKLSNTWGRLKDITQKNSLSRVLGDAYGHAGRYIKPFRDYVSNDPRIASCGKQIAVNLGYRPDQTFSPVNKMITVVADYAAYYESETAFTEMAEGLEKRKAASTIKRAGTPDL